MTVRERLDELMAEPAVADLGYPADQREVAVVALGLKLLADAIDELERRLSRPASTLETIDPLENPPEIHDLTSEIHDITEQVGKLAKLIKKASKQS